MSLFSFRILQNILQPASTDNSIMMIIVWVVYFSAVQYTKMTKQNGAVVRETQFPYSVRFLTRIRTIKTFPHYYL